MPFIKQIDDHEATGPVKKELDRARKRAGRVWNIVRIMSLNVRVMRDSMKFYIATMKGRSPVTRAQREMLAVVVSAANHCVY